MIKETEDLDEARDAFRNTIMKKRETESQQNDSQAGSRLYRNRSAGHSNG